MIYHSPPVGVGAGRTCLRAVMWLTLVVCDRRVNEAGTALCMLNPSPGRAVWRVVRVTAPVSVLLLWLILFPLPLLLLVLLLPLTFLLLVLLLHA